MDIKKSCAFNNTPIKNLNNKAQAIDKRLYLFAYYNPKAFQEKESPLVQFYSAVINLYGLFWDCGSFVINDLLQKRNCNGLLERDNQGALTVNGSKIGDDSFELKKCLRALRSSACHNNAFEYYYNQLNIEETEKYFRELNLNPDNLSSDDWEICLNEICKQADDVIIGTDYCLDWLNTLPEIDKERIINSWLKNGICKWYIKRIREFNGYLQALKKYHMANFSKSTSLTLSDWLQANFRVSDNSKWLEEKRLVNLLNDVDQCPTPALPIPVFKILADEVYCFVMGQKP